MLKPVALATALTLASYLLGNAIGTAIATLHLQHMEVELHG